MAAPQNIDEAIERNALGPASVTVAGQTVTQKNIDELVQADEHLKGKEAKGRPGLGIRLQKITPVYP
jgi:hypothetical protein